MFRIERWAQRKVVQKISRKSKKYDAKIVIRRITDLRRLKYHQEKACPRA
jgi:hypothetical protein